MISFFAEEAHVVIAPEKLFTLGGVIITNSIFYGFFCSIIIIFLLLAAAKRIKIGGTKGPAQLVEAGVDFIIDTLNNSFNNRRMAVEYAPIFTTLFFFILLSNWMGLLPGVGHSLTYAGSNLLRPFTADLNGTLAMAIFGMITVQVLAIKELGLKGYGKHYFGGKLVNPVTYLIGGFEIFSEFTRLITLGLRLFLNVAVGEILITVFSVLAGLFGPIAALPFTLLEIFVGLLQAYIFVVLCAAYLALAVSYDDHGEHATE